MRARARFFRSFVIPRARKLKKRNCFLLCFKINLFFNRLAVFIKRLSIFAFRIIRTSKEFAESTVFINHFRSTKGNMNEVSSAAVSGCADAVTLVLRLCGGLCLLCVGVGIFFLFYDDIANGNWFAFWVKVIGTALCILTGEWLYRAKPKHQS